MITLITFAFPLTLATYIQPCHHTTYKQDSVTHGDSTSPGARVGYKLMVYSMTRISKRKTAVVRDRWRRLRSVVLRL